MTQTHLKLGFGTCLSLIMLACGGRHMECGLGTKEVGSQCVPLSQTRDPLVGAWTNTGDTSGTMLCEFFGNGEWGNSCGLVADGWANRWERIYENRYYIGGTYRACDAETAFSADESAVTLSMLCGTTQARSVHLLRFR